MTDNNGKLNVLVDQVGRLTEGLTEFRADMAEIKGLVREQLAVSQSQTENIKRLTGTTERLAETTERLAETTERQMIVSERLAATVERQAQMLETLMARQH
jgi:methyl-accepting chemotaxis protein